jgi:hypothetical protein
MAHTHAHDDDGFEYTEQVCTIAISGLLGLVALLLYNNGLHNVNPGLSGMLAPSLWWTVLAGGIALLVLAAVQTLALAVTMRRNRAAGLAHEHGHCDHDHDHHHDHDHEQAHAEAVPAATLDHNHGHGHGHDHDHGWVWIKFAILLVPAVLFFVGMPQGGFQVIDRVNAAGLDAGAAPKVADKGDLGELGFGELQGAVYDKDRRELYEGKTVRIKGQVAPTGNDQIFSLRRYKIRCCAADAVPLDAFIMIDPASKEHIDASWVGQWVEVKGQVQFRSRNVYGHEEAVAVIFVRPDRDHPLEGLVRKLGKDEQPSPFL